MSSAPTSHIPPPKPGKSLAEVRPDLSAEWHPTRNGDLTPAMVTPGSDRKVWWLCPQDTEHEWQAVLGSRSRGVGCPFCSGRRATNSNNLSVTHPDVAAEWHPDRNGDLNPSSVKAQSDMKVWWLCPEDSEHEWQAVIGSRTRGAGCPFCAGQRPTSKTSLAATHTELAAEWHTSRNGSSTPEQYLPGSHAVVWWQCDKDPEHEWRAQIGSRTRQGRGCPFCAGQRATSATCLSAVRPDLAREWHPDRNGKLRPTDVLPGSNRRVWWKCPVAPDHEWCTTVNSRNCGTGCPACAGYQLSITNSLSAVRPDLAVQWHPTRNGELTPDQIVAGSTKVVWWKCAAGPDHEWRSQVAVRSAKPSAGCIFCAGQRASVTNSLATRRPDLADEWHPRRNGRMSPEDVPSGSTRRIWWRCSADPAHEWITTVVQRTFAGSGCPICATTGFNPGKPGTLYVLSGAWGKIGISNVVGKRLAQLSKSGAYGEAVALATFPNGEDAQRVERELLSLVANNANDRAPQGIEGYTESFPPRLTSAVVAALKEAVAKSPGAEIQIR